MVDTPPPSSSCVRHASKHHSPPRRRRSNRIARAHSRGEEFDPTRASGPRHPLRQFPRGQNKSASHSGQRGVGSNNPSQERAQGPRARGGSSLSLKQHREEAEEADATELPSIRCGTLGPLAPARPTDSERDRWKQDRAIDRRGGLGSSAKAKLDRLSVALLVAARFRRPHKQ